MKLFFYVIFSGESIVGNGKEEPAPDIVLNGVRLVVFDLKSFHPLHIFFILLSKNLQFFPGLEYKHPQKLLNRHRFAKICRISSAQSVFCLLSIARHHATLVSEKGGVRLAPQQGLVRRNGQELREEVTLQHQDRSAASRQNQSWTRRFCCSRRKILMLVLFVGEPFPGISVGNLEHSCNQELKNNPMQQRALLDNFSQNAD